MSDKVLEFKLKVTGLKTGLSRIRLELLSSGLQLPR